MAIDMKKFLARFCEEAREHVAKVNKELLDLEKDPDDLETLNSAFRSVHTIKGSSRMMKLIPISDVAHKLEEILDGLRERRAKLSKELSDILFKGVDAVAEMVETVARGEEILFDVKPLCDLLEKAAKGDFPTEAPSEPKQEAPACAPQAEINEESSPKELHDAETQNANSSSKLRTADSTVRVDAVKLDGLINLSGEMASGANRLRGRLTEVKELEKRISTFLINFDRGDFQRDCAAMGDMLFSLRSGLKRLIFGLGEDISFQEQLNGTFQDAALDMRMVPLSTLFETFHRSVRDIACSIGKKADLVIEGGETRLDKKMIEGIADPLVHMIRNAIDHGIESPQERLKAGKPEAGLIRLSACYDGESVLIELRDDGAGLPIERIKEKCIQKRIFSARELESMPQSRVIDVIFEPGFSTSSIITDISGRGVGMDVVKRNIVDHLKGSIEVDSKPGQGATFHIRLLLTLAVMDVLLVSVSGMTFAAPSGSVREIIRSGRNEVIDVVDRKAVRLREQIIPIADLGSILGLAPGDGDEKSDLLILIVSMAGETVGLIVESLLDEESVVMKPLPFHMQDNRLVSGVTTFGDNEVINILSIPEVMKIAREAKYGSQARESEIKGKKAAHILVVDDSLNTREIERSILEAYGYSVSLAVDGMEALEKMESDRYDLIVTDIEMPRLDGFSLTERVRKHEDCKDIPIVLVTSRDRESDKRRGIQVGANAYIVKGAFDQSNLLETIQNLIG